MVLQEWRNKPQHYGSEGIQEYQCDPVLDKKMDPEG